MGILSLFIATSLDGYIAKPNDDLSFLKIVEKQDEDYGYAAFTANIDTIILGRKTYDYVVREIPVLFGKGTRLFKDGRPEQALGLVQTKTFDTGLVQLY